MHEEIDSKRAELYARRAQISDELREIDKQIGAMEKAIEVLDPDWNEINSVEQVVDENIASILRAIDAESKRLPFVGFQFFRAQRLPAAIQRLSANEEFTQEVMKDLIDIEVIEVYHCENPKNSAYPTAAIRLTEHGQQSLADAIGKTE